MPPPQRENFFTPIERMERRIERLESALKALGVASENGDLVILTPGAGVIHTSPDGLERRRIRIDNSGTITSDVV